jgi:hypothetical protein
LIDYENHDNKNTYSMDIDMDLAMGALSCYSKGKKNSNYHP